MTSLNRPRRILRFGVFEVDLQAGELHKNGLKVGIREQLFQVLTVLLEHPGEMVTREELREQIWSKDTYVDFERSLNVAVSKLREALGDSAESPRFIETLPRRGYRFIYPVERLDKKTLRRRSRWRRRLPWLAVAAIVLAVAAGVGGIFFRPQHKELGAVPFTSLLGQETYPAISPNGMKVAFRWTGEEAKRATSPGDIYVKQVGGETASALTETPEDERSPAWSRDSTRIAFCRQRLGEQRFTIHIVEAVGGPEQQVGESYGQCHLAWSPDGNFLAVVDQPPGEKPDSIYLLSLQTRERRRLTSAPPGYDGDIEPAFSPDGRTLAFIRARHAFAKDIYLLSLGADGEPEGEPRRLTADNRPIDGLDWTPGGRSIVFAAGRPKVGSDFHLWRVPVSGGKVERLNVGDHVAWPSVSRWGNRLVYVNRRSDANLYRVPGPNAASTKAGDEQRFPQRLASSTAWDTWPDYSPDGRRIAYVSFRQPDGGVWRCDSDGSNCLRLTSVPGLLPRWSADGQSIAFTTSAEEDPGNGDIFVVSSEWGEPRRVTFHDAQDLYASWSRDGKWIYFGSDRSGDWQIWKVPSEGGEAVRVTRNGGIDGYESADGRFLYYAKEGPTRGIWRMPLEGGEETKVLDHGEESRWELLKDGICFLANPPDGTIVRFLRFSTRRIETVWEFPKETVLNGFAASLDGKWVLCALVERAESDLMLVENFR